MLLHACAVTVWATRTPIKINSDRPAASWAWNGGGGGGSDAGAGSGTRASPVGGRHAVPPLFRQPRAVVPPPFLQTHTATTGALDGDGHAASASSDDTVFASYYGEPEMDTNTDAYITGGSGGAGSSVEGSGPGSADPLALASDEANAPTGHLDEFGYPVASSSSGDVSPWGSEAAAWTQLAGSCWTYTTTAYEYGFCPFQNVTQKSLSSTLYVVMGVWDEWIETGEAPVVAGAGAADATSSSSAEAEAAGTAGAAAVGSLPVGSIMQSFTDGTACGSGKRRSTRVLFLCESTSTRESRISDVQEPATCEYTIKFHTPLVCPPGTAVQQQETAPDHVLVQGMQSCINALFVAQQTPRGAGAETRAAVVEQCRDYLSADDLASMSAPPSADTTVGALSSLVLEGDEAASVRANIPSSIVVDEDARSPSSHSNAVVHDEPLNGAFTLHASSSPYAALDDRDL